MEEASSLEVSIDIEKENGEVPLKTMVISLREELEKLSPLTPNHCIYRVPKQLHIKNPAAYTPKVVSIGPIHHKREGLEAMEEHKQRYMQFFLERVKISLEDYAEFVMIREGRLRECYSDTINYKSNEFVKIMMIDSAFVYEMLVRINYGVDESCRIFNRPYLVTNVMEDLLLLENQIPLFILNDLFELDMEATSCQQPISSLRSNGLEHPEEAINGEEHVKLGQGAVLCQPPPATNKSGQAAL
ncbi:hypothetical protein SAY86_023054 [Trapa natans]|uniref:Uncharacterized protein n=1 Tax=Trapa natans TaxID=22666 RepID=A0AAN7R5C1_TRANT|nr:hypothetical protein SAY86_023054 [Trapa natans]